MTIYFAASISGGRGDQAIWQIIEMLKQRHRAHRAFRNASLTAAGEAMPDCDIHDRDLEWLRSADVLVAEVTTPSLGVGYDRPRCRWVARRLPLSTVARRRLSG